jgi:HD-GYP domain-containing protein (c-di-GMP phosphodiesterase class II)
VAATLQTADEVAKAFATRPELVEWGLLAEEACLEITRESATLVLVWPEVWRDPERLAPHLSRARTGAFALVVVGSADELSDPAIADLAAEVPRVLLLTVPTAPRTLAVWLRGVGEGERQLRAKADLELSLDRSRYENELLIDIGRALSRKRNLRDLLDLVLRRSREVSGADAGSVYVVEGDAADPASRTLHFIASQNDSIDIATTTTGFTMPVKATSIVGTCVLKAQVISVPDLYALDPPGVGNNPWSFQHDRSFDLKHNYQTRSMLAIPMISARDHVIGVIQLMNKRARGVHRLAAPADFDRKVLPFDPISIEFVTTLASQAGIAVENAQLYAEVRTLFEGFVRASVTAIEARDPTTSGHSERVATLTVELAKLVDRVDDGPYSDTRFGQDALTQIEYAALLHDFGKVGVRENVLVKAEKLYGHERELIHSRFEYIRKTMEVERLESKLRYLVESSRAEVAERLAAIDRDAEARLREIDEFVAFILQANQPTVLEQGGFERIAEIGRRTFRATDGSERTYLTTDECRALQISRGSLTQIERKEIESHVVHTYNFLRQIPWGKTFRDVPEIAGAHHEKLDGTGYPKGLKAPAISPAARMMAIADIYDALTASDRPYKRAVPVPKALAILESEVKGGKLDQDLFDIFVRGQVWLRLDARS